MPYIPPSVVREVKRMDLLTYLKNYEPYELVHFSGNTYTTRTHDSLKISNGKWMWWSQRTGGRSALDYLIKVRGYSFLEAVELLAERANIQPPLFVSENVPMEKQLLLPKKNQDDQKVIAYLLGRGIDKEIIQFCLESGRVYESAFHHNVVFVGMDEKDNPKYAALRGIGTSFIGEANGSDKNYSFSIFAEKSNDTVHLFESAIDLLSYATLQKLDGKEWRREHLLSLAGVYQPAKEIEKSKVPAALARTLKMHPEVKTIVLHLDNDRIGRLATKAISAVLPKQYQVKDVPPKQGKDYNDLLCIKLNLAITKREKRTKKNMSGHEKYEREKVKKDMKIARYGLKVVYRKELILTMEDDVDSEELLKIFLKTQLKEEKEQSELLGIIAEKVSEESCTEQCESCQKYCPASEECMATDENVRCTKCEYLCEACGICELKK